MSTHYEVVRLVTVEEVVIVEAENEEDARRKGLSQTGGEVVYQNTVDVQEVTEVNE